MPLEDFFPASSPTLYHYTNIGALLGIVENRKLWASHAYYLNDSEEILYAVDQLVFVTSMLATGTNFNVQEKELLTRFPDWLQSFRHTPYHLFVFSLSEERSLLSQWRSYTTHGKGVSLGFDAQTLEHIVTAGGCKLVRCVYTKQHQLALATLLLKKVWDTFQKRVRGADATVKHPSEDYPGFFEEFRGDFLQALAIVKNPQFQEEREWRIVSAYFPSYVVPEVKFREGASMLLPYIELPLAASPAGVFAEVVLGPSQDTKLSHAALSNYLSNKGVCSVTINSEIPYRKW